MLYRTLLRQVTPPPGALLIISGLTLAVSLISLINPLLAGQLARTILATPGDSVFTPHQILFFWGLLFLVRAVLNFGQQYVVGSYAETLATRLRQRVYEHMQVLPLPYHQSRRRGDVLSLITNDADTISGFVIYTLLPLLPLVFTLVGAFAMMVRLDWQVAVLVIVCLPLYVFALKIMGRQIRPLSRSWADRYGALVARVEESLAHMPAIKSFGRESYESRRFRVENDALLALWRQQLKLQSLLSPAIDLLAGLALLAMLWFAGWHIEQGVLEPADLVSLVLYAGLLLVPLRQLANVYGELQKARGCAGRLLEFFAVNPEPLHVRGRPLLNVRGSICFENVEFSYPGRPAVLKGLNLDISAGETVAITGPNGAGKSTIAHLLMRFIDADAGTVSIDGQDIAGADLASVREHVGLVSQWVHLLNGSVAENIAYGNPDASLAAIEEVARVACAADFIEKLPQKYRTVIGDEGVRLSGGQRQRLALARTLLKSSPILILDEATAMFDPDGEVDFIVGSRELLSERTVILITHRPACLALADRVLRLEGGILVEVRGFLGARGQAGAAGPGPENGS